MQPIVGRGAAPHLPSVVGRISRLESNQVATSRTGDAPAGGDCRRKDQGGSDVNLPQFPSRLLPEAVNNTSIGTDKHLVTGK